MKTLLLFADLAGISIVRKAFFLIALLLGMCCAAHAQNPGDLQYPTALDSAKTLVELKDFARTQLSSGITNSATTIPVSSTASFPASGILVLDGREIVTYQAKDSISFLQVQRGQQGTPAVAHTARVLVEMRILSLPHNTLSTAIRNLQRKLGYVDSVAGAAGKFLLSTGDRQTAWTDHVLDSLTDVTITSAQDGDTLIRSGSVWINSPAGSGTVTSVGLVLPTAVFDISGTPITESGDFTVTFDTQLASRIFAGPPSGGAATPTFRALVSDDIPELALGTKTSGSYVASVATTGPIGGGAAGSEGATLTITCATCVVSSMAGTANEIASTGGTAPVLSIAPTFDISGKTSTIPWKSGTLAARPGTCTANKEVYNVTNPGTPGQQIYVCNATGDGWNLVGDGGGAGSIASLNGLTDSSQSFSTDNLDDNIVVDISSASGVHTINVSWQGIAAGDRGGTNNAFMQFTGPDSTLKTFTLPNASATILTTNALVAINQGGTGANSASGARSSLGLAIGTDVQAFDSDLAALASNSANGLYARTGAGTGVARTLTGTLNRITITNGDGVSGNPTFDIGSDVVTLTGSQTITNKTLTSPILTTPTINVGSDATGDIYYRNSGGAFTRLAIGSTGNVLTVAAGLPSWAAPTLGFTVVRKASDESVQSSTTVQNDDELLFAVGASETWAFDFYIIAQGDTTADIKLNMAAPAGATMLWGAMGLVAAQVSSSGDYKAPVRSDTTAEVFGLSGGTNWTMIRVSGTVVTAGNAGNVTLQWAQNNSSTTATIVKAGSHLIARKIT